MHKKLMSDIINESKVSGNEPWEAMYQASVTPWDKGQVTPALNQLLASGRIPNGSILVPGCGRGADVLALASPDRKAYGIDIAPSAVKACKDQLQHKPNPNAHFVCADFFKFNESSNPSLLPIQFDALYDYTFLCALAPLLRSQWASQVAALVKPGGTLITLMYPMDPTKPVDEGPPFPVTVELYRSLLSPEMWTEVSVTPCVSFPTRVGFEMVGVWERRSQ